MKSFLKRIFIQKAIPLSMCCHTPNIEKNNRLYDELIALVFPSKFAFRKDNLLGIGDAHLGVPTWCVGSPAPGAAHTLTVYLGKLLACWLCLKTRLIKLFGV